MSPPSPADITIFVGSLADQTRCFLEGLQGELANIEAEANTLRDENTLLHEKLESQKQALQELNEGREEWGKGLQQRDYDIQELKSEKDGLAHKVQAQELELQQLRMKLKDSRRRSSGSVASRATEEGKELENEMEVEPRYARAGVQESIEAESNAVPPPQRIFPAFTILHPAGSENYHDMFDDSTPKDHSGALGRPLRSLKSPKYDAQTLRDHEWKLSGIQDRAGPQNYYYSRSPEGTAVDKRSEDGTPAPIESQVMRESMSHASIPVPTSEAHRNDFAHPIATPTSRRDSLTSTRSRTPSKRPREEDDKDENSNALHRRRVVCTHCLVTSATCYTSPGNKKCQICQAEGIECMRPLCRHGLSCRDLRCRKLHPGQLDVDDERRIVEEGPNPRTGEESTPDKRFEAQREMFRYPRYGDLYRPRR